MENTNKARRNNAGKLKWSLVHFKSLEPMVQVLMFGAHKYSIYKDSMGNIVNGYSISQEEARTMEVVESGVDNWKNPMPLGEITDSAQRHLAALIDGEWLDPESGLPHVGHLMCNCMFLNYHYNND